MDCRRRASAGLDTCVCSSWEQEGRRIEDILDLYEVCLSRDELRLKNMEAEALLEGEAGKRLEESCEGKRRAYMELGYSWANYLLEDEKGRTFFLKALEQAEMAGEEKDSADCRSAYDGILRCSWRLLDMERAKQYSALFEKSLAERYEECSALGRSFEELHAGVCGRKPGNLYDLFCIHFFAGEYEVARSYVSRMEECGQCWNCSRKICTELWECRGYLALLDRDPTKAREYFLRASELRGNSDAQREIRRLLHGKNTS